jgi:hypothetical protein
MTFTMLLMQATQVSAQQVSSIHSNITKDGDSLYLEWAQKRYADVKDPKAPGISNFSAPASGYGSGIRFDFKLPDLSGTLYFGLINTRDGSFNLPVFFKRTSSISKGMAIVDLSKLKGKYDMSNWQKQGSGLLGYRVADASGQILYDGRVNFAYSEGNFEVLPTLIEGPLLSCPGDSSMVIRAVFDRRVAANLWIEEKGILHSALDTVHEFRIDGLKPATKYAYAITPGLPDTFYFVTAPSTGTRAPFTIAYASDSRSGKGGGERDIEGVNAYIMKRLFALAHQRGAGLFQFTGDMINGYLTDENRTRLQYANWKRSIEPFTRYMPLMATMGNHEALVHRFVPAGRFVEGVGIDRMPFNTHSAEAVFADQFAMPVSRLISEDNAVYDPDTAKQDFPPYRETVFSYVYGNTAIIALNSNYWYAYMAHTFTATDGNIHGYIMDNQLEWLRKEVRKYESDDRIAHIFLTLHTPFFPNGGHVEDDMWYGGNNRPRPHINGISVAKGIIERRDEMLDILVNNSDKFRAFLTGDEHNYARTRIGPQTQIYPQDWKGNKIVLKREIWQINNGSAGAPYYGQEKTPWSDMVKIFSTQYALVLLHIHGNSIEVEVVNPDTLEEIERFWLTEK